MELKKRKRSFSNLKNIYIVWYISLVHNTLLVSKLEYCIKIWFKPDFVVSN